VRAAVATVPGVGDVRFVAVDDTGGEDVRLRALEDDTTRILTPPYNLGHQGAIVYALRELVRDFAPDDLVVTMDSDGEDRPEDVPALLAPLLADRSDPHVVALARRTQRQEETLFRVSYLAFKAIFRVLTGKVVRSGNFAAMRGALVAATIAHPCFDQCYSSSLVSLPYRRREVPLPRGTRYSGQSRMNTFRLVTHGMHMLMPFLEQIAVRALIASGAGIGAGLAGLVVLVAGRLLGWTGAPWLGEVVTVVTLASIVGALTALTLFASAARSRAHSVRALHAESPMGPRES